jgi:hypothetical protein
MSLKLLSTNTNNNHFQFIQMTSYLFSTQKQLLVLLSVFLSSVVLGQVSISGAKCAMTALIYQYDIKGEWKEGDHINICVDGGVLAETNTTCVEKQAVSFVRVQWREGVTTGKITVRSQAGAADISVTIAPPLNSGFIQTADKQLLSPDKIPVSLSCYQASGGNCSPSFWYQWEESPDKLHWKEITGANGADLSFAAPLKQTTFFRRKVFERTSQTIGYTNELTVFVIPQAKTN